MPKYDCDHEERRPVLHVVKAEPPAPAAGWKPPPELGFDPEALRRDVLARVAKGAWEQKTLERSSCEEDRQTAEAIVRAKIILGCLPFICEAAAQANQLTADVYDIHSKKDLVNMPGLHDTAEASIRPTPHNLRNTAWLVYRACEALDLRPRIEFYTHKRADKGDFRIVIEVPYAAAQAELARD